MQDQLRILTCVLKMAVQKHGSKHPLTLGHLLNICKMVRRFQNEVESKEEAEHWELMDKIYTNGQD